MVANLSHHSLSSKGEADEVQIDPDLAEGLWTWNPSNAQDDESWVVKAFAEDTSSVMGATWPPRSYTCTFCRREFRSAQALGGHMNVHRKDRARLNQSQFLNPYQNPMSTSSSALIIPNNQEFASGGGLCVMYQLPHTDGLFPLIKMIVRCCNPSSSSSSKTFVSFPPYTSNPMPYPQNTNLQTQSYSQGNVDRPTQWSSRGGQSLAYKGKGDSFKSIDFKDCGKEELDLELRLGK